MMGADNTGLSGPGWSSSSDMMGADNTGLSGPGWSSSSDMMGADLVMKLRQDCSVQDGPVVVI